MFQERWDIATDSEIDTKEGRTLREVGNSRSASSWNRKLNIGKRQGATGGQDIEGIQWTHDGCVFSLQNE